MDMTQRRLANRQRMQRQRRDVRRQKAADHRLVSSSSSGTDSDIEQQAITEERVATPAVTSGKLRPQHEIQENRINCNVSMNENGMDQIQAEASHDSKSSTFSSVETSSNSESENADHELRNKLREWATTCQVANNTTDKLLKILIDHHHALPRTARTLLKTDRQYDIGTVSGLEYVYFGFKEKLTDIASNATLSKITISLNVDGLPLFKSSSTSPWPVLCHVVETGEIFVVAILMHKGDSKKNADFLIHTCDELSSLLESGIPVGEDKTLRVELESIMADAPARSLTKCTKTYSAYYGCDKCEEKGTYIDSYVRILKTRNLVLRTDAAFRNQSNPLHHNGRSPFLDVPGIDMIRTFPIDYMHSVLLGVMKKLLSTWTKGPNKLSRSSIDRVNARVLKMKRSIPAEFARKPRSLKELERWKATEFRLFLLYTGRTLMKGILPDDQYRNFMDLSVAMTILLSPTLVERHHMTAAKLLLRFVEEATSDRLYGPGWMVYNVHTLLHLTEEARRFGSLNRVSGFPFENHLQVIKRFVRKGNNVLRQLCNRIAEYEDTSPALGKQDSKVSVKPPNNVYLNRDTSTCYEICSRYQDGFVCRRYSRATDYFNSPIRSRMIGIYEFSTRHTKMVKITSDKLGAKSIKVKYSGHRIVVQMLVNAI